MYIDSIKNFNLVASRDGKEFEFKHISLTKEGLLGVDHKPIEDIFKITHRDYGLFESIPAGFSRGFRTLLDYVYQFKYVFTKKGAEQLGGFKAIGSIFPDILHKNLLNSLDSQLLQDQ